MTTEPKSKSELVLEVIQAIKSSSDITPHIVTLRTEVNQNKSLSRQDMNYAFNVLLRGRVDYPVPTRTGRFTARTRVPALTSEQLMAKVETITCVFNQVVEDTDEEGNTRRIMQRCTNAVTGTRVEISSWRSRCEDHRK